MITSRDQQVIDFLTEFKAARTATISTLFFPSYRMAQNRLNSMEKLGTLKRERWTVSQQFIYYVKRPAQIRHTVAVSDYVAAFAKEHKVVCYSCEPPLGSIRPDAAIGYIENGMERVALVEVELSNKGLDSDKYRRFENAERKKYFPARPRLIVVTDRRFIQPSQEYELVRI